MAHDLNFRQFVSKGREFAMCQILWVAPVLDMKGDAGSLDGLKVFGVPGRER